MASHLDSLIVGITTDRSGGDYGALVEQVKGNDLLFRAEDCARTVFMSVEPLCPLSSAIWQERSVTCLTREEAYTRLLTIFSGLESNNKGESHSINQFRVKCNDLRRDPERQTLAQELDPIFQAIAADVKVLQRDFLQNGPKLCFLTVVRDWVREALGLPIVLLGEEHKLVIAMAKKIGLSTTESNSAQLFVTTPEAREAIEGLIASERLFGEVTELDWSELLERGFATVGRLVLTSPLGDETLQPLIEVWDATSSEESQLILAPSNNLAEMIKFEEALPPIRNCRTATHVYKEHQWRINARREQLALAERVAAKMSFSRSRGCAPLAKQLRLPPEEYQEEVLRMKEERAAKRAEVERVEAIRQQNAALLAQLPKLDPADLS